MVSRWSMDTRDWHLVTPANKHKPSERYGHSAVIHHNKIFMYGGVMRSGHVSKELWSFHLESKVWTKEAPKTGKCLGSLCGEIHSAGHTATVVQNRMIVIFGHSPQLGYLDTVQEYHFGNKEWAIIETKGYPVKGGYGHSAVLDEMSNLIFVYGGYISMSSSVAQLSNSLYSFDHQKGEWKMLSSSPSFRYLHSASIYQGLMLVFGGNTHNDTQYSQGAKCYSKEFLSYDILCDSWASLDQTIPRDFSSDLDRFGHTAVLHNSSVYIYGGFNGQTKNDLVRFSPGECGHLEEREQCLTSRHGVKCVWNVKTRTCEVWGLEKARGKKTSVEKCLTEERNSSLVCRSQDSCQSCLSTSSSCVWCSDGCHSEKCPQLKDLKITRDVAQCPDSQAKELCLNLHTCDGCRSAAKCSWNSEKQCRGKQSLVAGSNDSEEGGSKKDSKASCPVSCSARETCTNCTSAMCMWCHNMQMCVDRNAYLASFPYGQCMDWTTHFEHCTGETNATLPNLCGGYDTCSNCHSNPACGWCDAGQNNGLGSCQEGGVSSPLARTSQHSSLARTGPWSWAASDTCSGDNKEWHFTSCPACQCNGHSVCSPAKPGECEQPCQDNTQGKHCHRCSPGYYGHPVNGGNCSKCECNGQGTQCEHRTGNCFCTTKGVTGDHCEKCDTQNHYFGNPINESCYYDLAIDYQFTFNLSKPEDKHYTAINFKNVPTKPDVDVDFSISCSVNAKMNLTYRHASKEGKKEEDLVLTEKNCSSFKFRFSKGDYTFGNEENTTFYVYVYDFQPPLWIIISFSQHPKLDLLQFFITFSTCFLALLLIAAILWKIKQKYDRYRRRQRLYVEMEQMASRPFGQVLTELERIPESESSHQHARKRKKKPRPSPIALEPCAGNRAAVLTLLVRMPTGGSSYAPPGVPGIALASSLVTLGNPRKVSVDPTQKVEADTNSKTRKNRKVVAATQPTDL